MDTSATEAQNAQSKCQHHWIIDDHNFGVCKKCGIEKQFPAYPVYGKLNYTVFQEHARKGAALSSKNKGKKKGENNARRKVPHLRG